MTKFSFYSGEKFIFKTFNTIFNSVRSTNQKIQHFQELKYRKIFCFIFFKWENFQFILIKWIKLHFLLVQNSFLRLMVLFLCPSEVPIKRYSFSKIKISKKFSVLFFSNKKIFSLFWSNGKNFIKFLVIYTKTVLKKKSIFKLHYFI